MHTKGNQKYLEISSLMHRKGNKKNKAHRHELKMLRYYRRLKRMGLKDGEGKFFTFRNHSCPCSCTVCSHSKYNRARMKNGVTKANAHHRFGDMLL